jgi:hypothetical protein
MNSPVKSLGLLCATLLGVSAFTPSTLGVQVNTGATSTNSGAKLAFVNASEVSATTGYVEPLLYGAFSNRRPATNRYYFTTNLVFRALSSVTNATSGGAAMGANLVCEVVSVTGPAGAVFAFWEQGEFWPTYEFPVGGTYTTNKNRFDVSDINTGAGRPDGDAFGSIPGRRFSVTKPGEYQVTFRLYDISENNPSSATPIHAPSDPLTIKFQTGTDIGIASLAFDTNKVATLTFRQGGITNLFVEASTNVAPANWATVAGPFASSPVGAGVTTQRFTNDPAIPSLFYRLRAVEP